MLRKYFVVGLILVFYNVCQGQTTKIDSLKRLVSLAKNNDEKLAQLQKLCRQGKSMPGDSLKKYANLSLQLSLQQKDPTKIWEAKFICVRSLIQRAKKDSALLLCNDIINTMTALDKNYELYHQVVENKIICLENQKKLKEAMTLAYELIKSGEKYKDLNAQVQAYNLLTFIIGDEDLNDISKKQDAYKQIIGLYRKALSVTPDSNFYKENWDFIYLNLGTTYEQLPKPNLDSAMFYVDIAYRYSKESNRIRTMAACLEEKGFIYSRLNKYDSSEYFFNQGIALEQQIGDPDRTHDAFVSIVQIYRDKKDFKRALAYDEMEKNLLIKNHMPLSTVIYQQFAEDYKSLGNYKAWGQVLDTVVAIKDSLYQQNYSQSFAEMQTKYETQKKETTIIKQQYELTKRNYLLCGTIGLALLSLVVARIIFVQYNRKQQLQLQLIHAEEQHQLNQAIAAAKEAERKRIAADLHDNIGARLSYISSNINFVLDAPQKMSETDEKHFLGMVNDTAKTAIIDLRETIWALNKDSVTFLEFADKLKMYLNHHLNNQQVVQLHINENITGNMRLSSAEAIHIFRIMQEAAGNSVKHAAASSLQLSINATEKNYALRLGDNGKGFDINATYNNHYGLENMQKRAAEIGANLQIESISNEGTSIVLKKEMKA